MNNTTSTNDQSKWLKDMALMDAALVHLFSNNFIEGCPSIQWGSRRALSNVAEKGFKNGMESKFEENTGFWVFLIDNNEHHIIHPISRTWHEGSLCVAVRAFSCHKGSQNLLIQSRFTKTLGVASLSNDQLDECLERIWEVKFLEAGNFS